jgi:carbonic anhydrase/acetyltransferase-like protein (isoleucine patch superfamily)
MAARPISQAEGYHRRRPVAIVCGVILAVSGHSPTIGRGAFIHPAACVIGQVTLGPSASVWPNATVRGDTDTIMVGAETNIQDGAVVHVDAGVPCTIGQRVTIGHQACVHGCTIEDEVLVGIGAIILNGAVVGSGSIIGAGALLTEGSLIPPGSLVIGSPGRVLRPTTDAQRQAVRDSAAHYVHMIGVHDG